MSAPTEKPVWMRAILRGAISAAVLFASFETLILAGKTTKIDTAKAALISLASGVAYAALWALFAVILAGMMKEFDARAKAAASEEKAP